MAFVIVFLFFCFFVFLKRERIGRVVAVKFLILTILVTTIFGFMFREPFLTRITGEGRLEVKSNQERLAGYDEGWLVVKQNWLKGVGVGNYTLYLYQNTSRLHPESWVDTGGFKVSEEMLEKLREKKVWDYQPIHNLWLLVLTELGVFGLLFFVGIVFSIFNFQFSIFKKTEQNNWALISFITLIAVIILSFFDHYFWSFYFGIMMWWLVLGLTCKTGCAKV